MRHLPFILFLISYSVIVIGQPLYNCNPVNILETKFTASDGFDGDEYGKSVAISDTLIVVGSPFDDDVFNTSGSAYVYNLNGGIWYETKLTASNPGNNDRFGSSVDVDDQRIVVGSPLGGSVYVYDWDGSQWVETILNAPISGLAFGTSVAVSGDMILVGAQGDGGNGSMSGLAYLFEFNGSTWDETLFVASDGDPNDRYGEGVNIFEDRLVMGAHRDDDAGTDSGAIYVYDWDGSTWVETKISASDGGPGDFYGQALAVYSDRIIVGSQYDDDNGSNSGSAYIYDWDGSNWNETKITPSDGTNSSNFGNSVDIQGDRIAVGARGANGCCPTIYFMGSVYIYEWDGSSWVETKLEVNDPDTAEYFGEDVAISEARVVGGTPGNDDIGSDSGSITFFECNECIDVSPPIVVTQDITLALDINSEAFANPMDVDNGSSDECGIASYSLDVDYFTCLQVGQNNVVLTVVDGNGNSGTGSAIIQIDDVINPIAICQDVTIQLDASGVAVLTNNQVNNGSNDLCGIASITLDQTQFICEDLGSNTVTLTATDIGGNTSTCTSVVMVEDSDPTCLNCPPSDITFTSQQDISDFVFNYPTCTEILGNLQIGIGGSDITDLTPLSQLTAIYGHLRIIGNPMLVDLDGLENLNTVDGELEVLSTQSLVSLIGLEGVSSLNGQIRIWSNTNLINLNGLENLQSIDGDISIKDNPALVDISGISTIEPASVNHAIPPNDDLKIQNNISLGDCAVNVVCGILDDPTKDFAITGNTGDCIQPSQVISACNVPACTTITNPVDGATNVERDVTVEWTPEPDADYYSFTLRQGLNGPFIIEGENIGLATIYDLEDLLFDTTYYVIARSFNSFGFQTSCEYSEFTIKSLPIHPTAQITAPQDGALLYNLEPTITWDEIPNIDHYDVVIDGGTFNDFHWTTTNLFYDVDLEWNSNYTVEVIAYTNTGDGFLIPEISFSTGDGASYSFDILDENNEHQFTQLRFMNPDTYEVYFLLNSQGNPNVVELPKLPMMIAYRSGDSVNEVEFDFTNEIGPSTLYLDPTPDPGHIEDFYFQDRYLFVNDDGNYYVHAKLGPSATPDSIFWYNNVQMVSGLSTPIGKIRLLDDGNGNDEFAGDKIYTSTTIPSLTIFPFLSGQSRNNTLLSVRLDEGFQFWEGGSSSEFSYHEYRSLGLVNRDSIEATPLVSATANLYHNDYVVNIVRPNPELFDPTGDAQILYNTFQDTFEQIMFHYTEHTSINSPPFHTSVSNQVSGIGLNIFDNSSSYGSGGKLQGFNILSDILAETPYNHEISHQWMAHLQDLFNDYGAHWGYSSVGGVHGGEPESNYQFIGNNQISVPSGFFSLNGLPGTEGKFFSDIELYLMGVMDPSELREDYTVFEGMINLGGGIYEYDNQSIHTKADIISYYGARNPAPITTGIEMRTAMVVITDEPLSLAGVSYYTYLAKAWEGSITEPVDPFSNFFSFDKATDYRVDMITRLPDVCLDDVFEFSNPTVDGTYQAANSLYSIGLIPDGANVSYGADLIELQEGFEVELGAIFEAIINPCSN